jgi:hypothetical protein
MSGAAAWLEAQGFAIHRGSAAIETMVVAALIVAALAIGLFAGRWLGPRRRFMDAVLLEDHGIVIPYPQRQVRIVGNGTADT